MNRQDYRLQVSQRGDCFLNRVRNVVELEVEEDRHVVLGDANDAFVTVGAEELQAEFQPTDEFSQVPGKGCGAVDVLSVDGNKNGIHMAGVTSSVAGWDTTGAAGRSKTSSRLRIDQMRARITSQ